MGKQMAEGIEHIHASRIVHRDVKPDNFLLSGKSLDEGVRMHVGLTDFDCAVKLNEGQVLTKLCGTERYMAPEMLLDEPSYGLKVDIWALGVSLYGMINRSFPFKDHKEVLGKPV